MPFDPNQYLAEKTGGNFDPDKYLAVKGLAAPQEVNPLDSAVKGFTRTASLGLVDKLAGALGSPTGAAKSAIGYDSADPDVANYIRAKQEYQQGSNLAQTANPKSFLGGQGVGLVATGGAVGQIPSAAGRALALGGMGAAQAAGESNAPLLSQQTGQAAARGFGIGAGTGMAGEIVAPAIMSKIGQGLGSLGKKVLNIGLDIPESASSFYMKNPEMVNNALSSEELPQKLADTMASMKEDTGPLAEKAMGSLRNDRVGNPAFSASDVIGKLKSFDKPATNQLAARLEEEYSERLASLSPGGNPGYLTEAEMHEAKKSIQGLMPKNSWASPISTGEDAAISQGQGELNSALKASNPEYASGMNETAQNIQLRNAFAQKFGIQKGASESGMVPTDRTIGAINQVARGNRIDAQGIVDQANAAGYGDLGQEIQASSVKNLLSGEGKNTGIASRNVIGGAAIGGALGHSSGVPFMGRIGAAAGAIAGKSVDKYGPAIGKGAMDMTLMVQKLSDNPATIKYAGALKDAATRGMGAIAATHFILSQTEPEYQKAMEQGQ